MIPPIDIHYISDEIARIADLLKEAAEDVADSGADASALTDAMDQLLAALILHRSQTENSEPFEATAMFGPQRADITALGNHGIDLLTRLAALAEQLNRSQLGHEIEVLAVPLACWIARCDAEIINLNPVVNGAAALANRLEQLQHLAQLYGLMREIGNAVSPLVSQNGLSADTSQPWRVFLLNKAIVATRSHQPVLMEEAFDALSEQLPEDAAEFFREGMEQMNALDYPPEVRHVMERWYVQWCGQRVLH